LSDLNLDRIGVEDDDDEEVLTGISVSLRDHPSELIESRKALEAMFASDTRDLGRQREAATELHTTTGFLDYFSLSLTVVIVYS